MVVVLTAVVDGSAMFNCCAKFLSSPIMSGGAGLPIGLAATNYY